MLASFNFSWLVVFLILAAGSGISLGIFSFFAPSRSIGLYQWLMALFNWRVEPIDRPRELATTRVLGILMTILSFLILAVLAHRDLLRLVL